MLTRRVLNGNRYIVKEKTTPQKIVFDGVLSQNQIKIFISLREKRMEWNEL